LRSLIAVGGLYPPRILASTLLAILTTALVCWPVWPGLMSYDSLYAYRQSIEGIETADWPPMHDYLFYLSRRMTGGPGGLLATQAFVLFASVSAIIAMFARTEWRHLLGFALFVAGCFYFPTLLGTLIVNWKDVPLAAFGLLAVALWLLAVRYSSRLLLVLVALPLVVALGVRLNSLPLLLPFLVAFVVQPYGRAMRGARAIAMVVIVGSIAAASMSTLWRLPDLKRLPPLGHTLAGVQLWDLIGTSACAGKSLLPPSYTGDGALSVAELRALYDPRHIDLTVLRREGVKPLPTPPGDVTAELADAWKAAIRVYPGCYLHHRQTVFAYQMGFAERVFIPTHGGIDDNDYGIAFRNRDAAEARIHAIESGADRWARRPFWLFVFGAGAVFWAVAVRNRSAPVVLLLGLGAVLYVCTLIVLAPAADARYIFPSNIFCALLIAIALSSSGEGEAPARDSSQ